MLNNVKTFITSLFRLFGLDIKRVNSSYGWLLKYDIATVLDIGANTGQFAGMIHKILPNATIFSFEPIEQCYRKLTENMKRVSEFRSVGYKGSLIDFRPLSDAYTAFYEVTSRTANAFNGTCLHF